MPRQKKANIPPYKQPGGHVLATIQSVTFRWTRGEIGSEVALSTIHAIVHSTRFEEALLEVGSHGI